MTTTAVTSGGVYNALIAGNKINGVVGTSAVGFSAAGIAIAGDPLGGNVILNNMITGVTAPSTAPDLVAGIFVAGVPSSTTKVYFNSVSQTGDRGVVTSQIGSYCLAISGATIPLVDVENNIFYTTQIASGGGANAKSYVLGTQAAAAGLAANLTSNFNVFFASGANAAGFRTGSLDATGTDFATLATWQAATTKDPASLFADPLFVNAGSDLHIMCSSPASDVGTVIGGVTTDIDGQTRSATPDIGADEMLAPTATSVVSRKIHGVTPYDIVLPAVECRSGGGGGDFQVIFNFASPVTFTSAAVTAGTGSVMAFSGGGTNAITVDLTGVTDAQNLTVTLNCASDGVNSGNLSAVLRVLLGDINNSASVSGSDVASAKSQSGMAVTGMNFRNDVNVSDSISGSDVAQVKSRSGNSIP